MSGACAPADLLSRYARGLELAPETVGVLEAHLERCACCRQRLAAAGDPALAALIEEVRLDLLPYLGPGHGAWWARRHRLRRSTFRWAVPAVLPWLAVAVLVPLAAMLLDLAGTGAERPPLLLLVAPVAPVFGVAAAWNRWTDPAYELMSVTARAGLTLLLRRTLTVLLAMLPPLALGGAVVGAAPVRWLLPCLACTTTTLALGALIGVARAAAAVTALWTLAVILPAVARAWPPVALEPGTAPAWIALLLLTAGALVRFRHGYRRLS